MNRVYIQQETKIVLKSGKTYKRISICDDFGYDVINLENIDFFTDPLEILRFILTETRDIFYVKIEGILQRAIEDRGRDIYRECIL